MVGVYAALVLAVSLMPVDLPGPVSRLDKAAHLCEYLIFAWLLVQAIRASEAPRGYLWGGIPSEECRPEAAHESRDRMPEQEYRLWAWIYATSYGILIELLQALVPWRSAELWDAVASAVGAALGVWLGDRLPRRS